MSRELERLARRIAAGDVAAARRALALLEGMDVADSCARSLSEWWREAVDSAAKRLVREIQDADDRSPDVGYGVERVVDLIDSMLPWTPDSSSRLDSAMTASYLMLAGARKDPVGAVGPSPHRDAVAAFRSDVVRRIVGEPGRRSDLHEALLAMGYDVDSWSWRILRAPA